ncbi:MAG: methionyl-tRNA formyltransferase, partial [Desulfobacterales bacterium]
TPDFAVPPLMTLTQTHHQVLLAVTQPDRPKGRGCKICCTQVKEAAQLQDVPIAQPARVKDPAFVAQVRALAPDLIVVAAFGQILPTQLLEIPPLGAINIHASLLPKYRGAAPIQHAILNRESVTGITIMQMDAGMDTGAILTARELVIAPNDTAGSLHDRLSILGADLLMEALEGLAAGTSTPVPQDHTQASYAPMLKKKDGKIDWRRSAIDLEAFVRGMNPWPGAFTLFGDKRLLIYEAQAVAGRYQAPPGTVVQGFDDELRIAAGEGALAIEELQQASGRRMSIADYLRGCCISPGTIFS